MEFESAKKLATGRDHEPNLSFVYAPTDNQLISSIQHFVELNKAIPMLCFMEARDPKLCEQAMKICARYKVRF